MQREMKFNEFMIANYNYTHKNTSSRDSSCISFTSCRKIKKKKRKVSRRHQNDVVSTVF